MDSRAPTALMSAPPILEPLSSGPEAAGRGWRARFTAMANPCELLIETDDAALARQLAQVAQQEALRIEHKFSRYRDDGIIHRINHGHGAPLTVDDETAQLIDYGVMLWQLSDGAFDLSSGALRRIWKFSPGATPPSQPQIDELLTHIGWHRVSWHRPQLTLPVGMELDLGGIGKEYAVDRVAGLITARSEVPVLVNFGGDLRAVGRAPVTGAWQVGVEDVVSLDHAQRVIHLAHGALATSGDTRRVIEFNGQRYGHIMDARTGWPAAHAPRSVTVLADTCVQAGSYTTLAMLKGREAESFLQQEGVRYWCFH